MPKSVIQYSLLISCPGDIKEEINCVEECVTQFNTLYSDALGIEIVTKHWRKKLLCSVRWKTAGAVK